MRLSLSLGRLPAELAELLTLDDLAAYQALVELDGPFWLEGTAAQLRILTSVVAATAGAELPADRFAIEWNLGRRDAAEVVNLLPPADGLALWAGRYGLDLVAAEGEA
jgi:TolB-like protein